MTLVPVGLWVAIVGYGIAYTGMKKLGGDPTYSLKKAFRGEPAATTTRSAGSTAADARAATQTAQASVIGPGALASA